MVGENELDLTAAEWLLIERLREQIRRSGDGWLKLLIRDGRLAELQEYSSYEC